jgi:subtilisin
MDAELDNSWGVKRIGAGTVHTGGNKGMGVKIGIIDSGINYTHSDLDGVYVASGSYDFVQNDNDPMDVYGHGTHVAGTACAEDNNFGVVGVAPSCALYALRVLNDDGVGSWSRVIAAMDWAVTNSLQVVNLSLGSSKNPGTAVKTAFDNAEAAGVVIVAAAGNSGNTAGKGDNIIYPAKYASVIAVGATDSTDKRASFSSTGSALELVAPGVSVLSTWNDSNSPHDPQPICVDGVCYYKYGSGTSMASPHVAGVAALVLAKGVTDANGNGRINDEVRQKMNSTAQNMGAAGRDTQYGYGLVNAAAATAQ